MGCAAFRYVRVFSFSSGDSSRASSWILSGEGLYEEEPEESPLLVRNSDRPHLFDYLNQGNRFLVSNPELLV
jgi:hypothetical protein